MEDKTAGRIYSGTMNFAGVLTVHNALDYCDQIGWQRKADRLKSLRDIWAVPAHNLPGVHVLTPNDARLSAAITSFRLEGRTSTEDNAAIVNTLMDEFGIFTVHRIAPGNGACIRVTPSLATSPQDCERLLDALAQMTT